MPGVNINDLPDTPSLTGAENFVIQEPPVVPGTPGITRKVSSLVVQSSLAPFVPTAIIDAVLAGGLTSNFSPVGLATASLVRCSSGNVPFSIDGILAPTIAKFLILINANTTIGGTMSLVDATGSASAAANQILTEASAGITVLNGGGIWLYYDEESAKWRVIG